MTGFNLNIAHSKINKNTINLRINTSESTNRSEYENAVTQTRPTKRSRHETIMPNEKDKILEGFKNSVGNMIKQPAHEIYKDQMYHKLNNTENNSVDNRLNSILDLMDSDSNNNSQRNIFTDNHWLELNHL
ncbi:hypothetical protein BDB01DRAFT_849115 [Pilobolus umbonatus]|nr:hypothetical protein BDB01DRAFT_849115 [Pilobolus umbonatus]